MIDVNEEMKLAYDTSTIQVDKIIVEGKEYRITNVQYSDDCYEEGNIFGTAIARMLEFEIENVVNLEKKEFEYFTGIYINNKINWISLGSFITQDTDPNDTTNISKITAMDYMLKSNIEYKSNLKYNNTILLDVAEEACNQAGIILATKNFANCNFKVDSNQFEKKTLIRQVFQAIAQISGTVAKIRKDNKLYFINPCDIKTTSKIFTLNNYEEAEIKRVTQPINVVTLGMKDIEGENITLRDEDSISNYGEHSLIINNNPFAYTQQKREQLITALFNAVKGFDYKAYTFKCQALPHHETLDKIQFKDKKGNIYDSYIFRFNYKSPNGLESSIEAPSIIKATVEYQNVPDATEISKRTEIMVDKQNQIIQSVVSNTEEQNQKINEVTQTLDELRSHISEVADLTTSAEGNGYVRLEKINESEPIRIVVRPVGEDISYLYPNNNLFPSDDLFPQSRSIRFETTGFLKDWEIPDDLLYYDAEHYDELILDYEGQSCVINKKVEYDANGQKKPLEATKTISYPYPKIELPEGDYTITLLEYPTGYIFVRLMTQNIYTTQFATKAEMNSEIKQTVSEIDLSVNKKLSNYSTTTEMNSAINLKIDSITSTVSATYATKTSLNETKKTLTASLELKLDTEKLISEINASADVISLKAGRLLITSGNFKLDDKGNITCIGGKIGGFTLSLTEFRGELDGIYDYDAYDLKAVQNLIMENLNVNTTTRNILDINNDGKISSIDYMTIKGIIENNITNTKNVTGTFKIDSTNPKKCISILKNGEICVSLGLGGINANLITADNIICAYGNLEQTNYRGVVINGRVPNIKLVSGSTAGTTITFSSVTSQAINNTSLESIKKNITKFDNALEIIENSEIYEYNFKTEKNEDKKHIGFVIGEKYKTPDIVKSNDGQAIESYSMSSISWRGLQQVIEILKRIDKRLKVLEGK